MPMDRDMMESGEIIKDRVMVHCIQIMIYWLKEYGKMIYFNRDESKQNIMKEDGKIMDFMDKVYINSMMVESIKDNGTTTKRMEEEPTTIAMEIIIKVTFLMDLNMEREYINTQLEISMKDNINLILNKVQGK